MDITTQVFIIGIIIIAMTSILITTCPCYSEDNQEQLIQYSKSALGYETHVFVDHTLNKSSRDR